MMTNFLQDKIINGWIKEYCEIYNITFTKELKKEVYCLLSSKYDETKESISSDDVKEILKEKKWPGVIN
jgi:hypothetical protein